MGIAQRPLPGSALAAGGSRATHRGQSFALAVQGPRSVDSHTRDTGRNWTGAAIAGTGNHRSSQIQNNDAHLAILRALCDEGVRLGLDDFGTAYSSMSYLEQLPFTNIKVDQTFVQGLPDEADRLAIVKAIVSLAKNLGFAVTGEGVETLDQASLLKSLGGETMQGYFFSEPIPGENIPTMLGTHYWFGDKPAQALDRKPGGCIRSPPGYFAGRRLARRRSTHQVRSGCANRLGKAMWIAKSAVNDLGSEHPGAGL
jgi:hypothetical protein